MLNAVLVNDNSRKLSISLTLKIKIQINEGEIPQTSKPQVLVSIVLSLKHLKLKMLLVRINTITFITLLARNLTINFVTRAYKKAFKARATRN